MESEYLKTLILKNRDVGKRYLMKLSLINNLDPFTLNTEDLDYSLDGVPPVTNMDIVAYLVLTHSFYTKEQMKAFKSLQAYKYFESGFVLKTGTKLVNDCYILLGKVKHSQKANLKPLEVWSIIAKDGSICTAHCTCMAGNSEVCSHVGAILFAAEYANNKKQGMSCTDVRAMWPMPSTSTEVPIVPIHDMDWGRTFIREDTLTIPTISASEMVDMLKDVTDADSCSALMRIVEPYATDILNEVTKMLPTLFNIFQETNIAKTYSELLELSKNFSFSLSEEDILSIEKGTRGQIQKKNWYIQRSGRITASRLKAVCKTNKIKPSLSLIKAICYPAEVQFTTKATSWGIAHEKVAVEEYRKCMADHHDSFIVNEVGLLINKQWPQLAATPDMLVFCECCLGGCLEVKCPYLLHVNNIYTIDDYVKMRGTCLVKKGDVISLDSSHSYYYQIQMQIFISQLRYCDFVIWSPNIFFKERILPDHEFWNRVCPVALKFHSDVIMPELLGRYFTSNASGSTLNWCNCNGLDDGRPMIKCNSDNCEIEWFHFECVQLVDTPDFAWYCNTCSGNN